MDKIITVNFKKQNGEWVHKLTRPAVQNLAPAAEYVTADAVVDHKADPIKDVHTIHRISDYLVREKRYRDNMLFILGINFGLRVSDLVRLRFSDLINPDMTFKTTFPILEKKTSQTRKVAKNRYITINNAVMDAVELYLENTDGCCLTDYLFRSESCNAEGDAPLHRNSVDRILKGIAKDLNLDIHMSTHTLRKTFGYHQMAMGGNTQRKLLLLQKMFGHSSPTITLNYIGLTDDEIMDAYKAFNLGGDDYSIINSKLTDDVAI